MTESKLQFDWTINVSMVITAILLVIGFLWGYWDTKRDIQLLQERQKVIEESYVTQEYLEIVVVERIDRLDVNMGSRLSELETKLTEWLGRIEQKLDE